MARGNPPARTGTDPLAAVTSPPRQDNDDARRAATLESGWLAESEPHGLADCVIDSEGWSEDELTNALRRLVDSGVPLDARVVVVFAPEQVDAVAAALLGTEAQLLCRPTPIERAGALVLARTVARQQVGEPPRPEAARLAVIAEEVARIAEALSGLAGRDSPAGPVLADRRMTFDDGSRASNKATLPVTAGQVRGAIRSRRTRDAIFGAGWFEEPAWDMLLDLFAAELEGARVSVSSLCIAAAVAQTTALRWISKMIAAGLLERQDDATDRRRAFVTLSERADANMRSYFGAVERMGLAIA